MADGMRCCHIATSATYVSVVSYEFFFFPFLLRASLFVPSVSSNHTLFKAAKSGRVQQANWRFSSYSGKAYA